MTGEIVQVFIASICNVMLNEDIRRRSHLETESVCCFQPSHQAVLRHAVQTLSARKVHVSVILVFKVTDTTAQVCVNRETTFLFVKHF